MDEPSSKCTLYAVFAAASPQAAIYRRGPSRHTCLIAWNRADDTFRIGQWFKGVVKPSWGGLSPNGEWLLTFLGKYTGPFGTWTVLSKPPYLTALSLWPMGDTWHGGGWFLSDEEMVLEHGAGPYDLAPGFLPPPGLTVLPYRPEVRAGIDQRTIRPWRWTGREASWAGPHGHVLVQSHAGLERWVGEASGRSLAEAVGHRLVVRDGPTIPLPQAGWSAFDGNGDVLFSQGGRLYRLGADAIGALDSAADPVAASRCLADFSDLRFTGLPAPYETPREKSVAMGEDAAWSFAPRIDRRTREDRRAAKRLRRLAARQNLTEFR